MPRLKNLNLTLKYEDDLHLFQTRQTRLAYTVGVVLLFLQLQPLKDDLWHSVGVSPRSLAICALGLSLLTGFTGQVSLAHACFLGVGAYCAVYFGARRGF